jgi:putative SOS response-associated peptidase YedK
MRSADVAPYHDRQMAVLKRVQRADWLVLSDSEHELLRPLRRRTFQVERIGAAKASHPTLAI